MSIRSPLAERLLGRVEPSLLWVPSGEISRAVTVETLQLADAYPGRGVLDGPQRQTVEAAMGVQVDGRWAASTVGRFGPRQSTGKTAEVQAILQYKLTQLGEKVLFTAHEVPTAKAAFLRLVEWFESYDDLRRKVRRVFFGNGDQAIELRNGGVVQYKTRTGGNMRGLDEVGTLVVDEAQHAKPEHLAASTPTMAMHPNPQVIFAGSGGFARSDAAWTLRRTALAGTAKRFAYIEHSAQQVWVDPESGKVRVADPDPADRQAWSAANPSLGRRWLEGEEFLESQFELLGPEEFAREHLCVWTLPPDPEVVTVAVLEPVAWADAAISPDRSPTIVAGEVTFGFDVHDGWGCVVAAVGTLSRSYVEITGRGDTADYRRGVAWLPARLTELVERWRPPAVGFDGGSGAASAAHGEIREAFLAAGLDPDILRPLSTGEYRAACGSFATAVADGKVSRPAVAPDHLAKAGDVCAARIVGDSWLWDRKAAKHPVSPLVAASVARALLAETAPVPVAGFTMMVGG